MVELVLRGASRVGEEERHALVHATTWEGSTAMHCTVAQRGLLKLCRDDELDFLLSTKTKAGRNPFHLVAYRRYAGAISHLLRGVRERGWRRGQEQEEWRNSLNGTGLTALHLAIISPENRTDAVKAVRALLAPAAEEAEDGEGKKRKEHPGEEEEKGKERMEEYEGGVDPNKGCKGRTGELWRLNAAEEDGEDDEDDDDE
jgi:hypothetical protein